MQNTISETIKLNCAAMIAKSHQKITIVLIYFSHKQTNISKQRINCKEQ